MKYYWHSICDKPIPAVTFTQNVHVFVVHLAFAPKPRVIIKELFVLRTVPLISFSYFSELSGGHWILNTKKNACHRRSFKRSFFFLLHGSRPSTITISSSSACFTSPQSDVRLHCDRTNEDVPSPRPITTEHIVSGRYSKNRHL